MSGVSVAAIRRAVVAAWMGTALAGCGDPEIPWVTPRDWGTEAGHRAAVGTLTVPSQTATDGRTEPRHWIAWDTPYERHGRVVGRLPDDTAIEVTGTWSPPVMEEIQVWERVPGMRWVRINATDPGDGGTVQWWARVPDQWIRWQDEAPTGVEPPWGHPASPAPAGRGVRASPVAESISLRARPCTACSEVERLEVGMLGPVSGRTMAEGQEWLRIESRQTVGWAPRGLVTLRTRWGGLLGQGRSERTCTRLAWSPEDMWGLCDADEKGAMLDPLEREYDSMEPERMREKRTEAGPADPHEEGAEV